ncbi:hypothetical protein MKX01_017205 [Papaver californicum]|nr:hypothetical protein MKX01_017205 [Papaver californicum]
MYCLDADGSLFDAALLSARVKETTGIVGLDVVPNAREVLISLHKKKKLNEIKAVPEDEGYRKAVESFTQNRLKVREEEHDWEQIEKKLACGQVEELIEEAVTENDSPVPKHVPLHRPGPLPEEFFKTLEAITLPQRKMSQPLLSSLLQRSNSTPTSTNSDYVLSRKNQ